jgi:hypothetical protein
MYNIPSIVKYFHLISSKVVSPFPIIGLVVLLPNLTRIGGWRGSNLWSQFFWHVRYNMICRAGVEIPGVIFGIDMGTNAIKA